jgi:hypothetical protein
MVEDMVEDPARVNEDENKDAHAHMRAHKEEQNQTKKQTRKYITHKTQSGGEGKKQINRSGPLFHKMHRFGRGKWQEQSLSRG